MRDTVSAGSAESVNAVRVVLDRFDPLVSRGLREVLAEQDSVELVATVNGRSVESVILEHRPDIVIFAEGSVGGTRLLRRLRSSCPETGVLVLAHWPSRAFVARVEAAGARCLTLSATPAELVTVICVAARASPAGSGIARGYSEQQALLDRLTVKEREVYACLREGQRHREIAEVLNISVETARTHTANIRCKLGVRYNRELIALVQDRA